MQPKCNVNECVKIDSKFRKLVGEKKKERLVFVTKWKRKYMNKNVCLDDIGFTK